MGCPGFTRSTVRAHPAAQPVVLLAQANGQPDHSGVRRYRPALGVPGVWDRRCVPLAGAAPGTEYGTTLARLEAWSGDDVAGAALLLGDLPARRKHQPVVHPGVAEVVARDGRAVGHHPRNPSGEGVQPGGPGNRTLRRA